jgi:hypothetical protein
MSSQLRATPWNFMTADEPTYSLEEVVVARMALRRAAGDSVGRLCLGEFLDVIYGEVDMLRNAGFADHEIAAVIERALGRSVEVKALGACRSNQVPLDASNEAPDELS